MPCPKPLTSPGSSRESLQDYPHASRRSVVLSPNGMVATSQPLAAQAGLRMLLAGGTAVDAALASAIALTVLEPTSNGIGGDAFALVWDGTALHGLNASGRSPAALDPDGLRADADGSFPAFGWPGVTVPGAPDGWRALNERFGRLPLDQVMAPAIEYAAQGHPVSPVVARLWGAAASLYLGHADPALADWRTLFAPGGSAPGAGERWVSPGHAACLERLCAAGIRDFYEGEVAGRIADHAAATGGLLTRDDLASHVSEWVEPISVPYRGHEVWEIPPNGQGIAALQALGILDGVAFPAASYRQLSPEACHLQIEAMKLGFADAYRYVADPEHGEVPVAGLLDPSYLAARRAQMSEQASVPHAGLPAGGGTVYLGAADRDGMMVSYIQSNYMGFGSGVVLPDLGISFQNRGAGFVLDPGHPNHAAPRKRPRHTIIPGFLTRAGQAIGPFGVMGGEMQPQGHLQVVSAMLDRDHNPQAALDAPRWRVLEGRAVEVEADTSPELIAGLRARTPSGGRSRHQWFRPWSDHLAYCRRRIRSG